jgi:hypothetical protein
MAIFERKESRALPRLANTFLHAPGNSWITPNLTMGSAAIYSPRVAQDVNMA